MGFEESWNAMHHHLQFAEAVAGAGVEADRRPSVAAGRPVPELAQASQTVLWTVAGNDCAVDCPDRRPDDPVRLDAGFVKRLINPRLGAAMGAAPFRQNCDHPGLPQLL